MRLELPWGVIAIALGWAGLIAWVAVKMLTAPEGREDERGFRVVQRKP